MRRIGLLSMFLFVTASAAADKVDYTKEIDYKASNPCTNEPIRVSGKVHVNGTYKDTGNAYRFSGQVDSTDVQAQSLSSNRTFRSVGAKDR